MKTKEITKKNKLKKENSRIIYARQTIKNKFGHMISLYKPQKISLVR